MDLVYNDTTTCSRGRKKVGVREDEDRFYAEVSRSDNFSLSPQIRSRARHEFIDLAEKLSVLDMWVEAGQALIRAAEGNDLSAQVSDHFVRVCPDEAFEQFPYHSAAMRFTGWRERIRAVHE